MPHLAGTSAQRIRIGLTGLAFAFLLVLLGSIISKSSGDVQNNGLASANSTEPSEPLAELGVAPGAAQDEVGVAPAAAQDEVNSTNLQ